MRAFQARVMRVLLRTIVTVTIEIKFQFGCVGTCRRMRCALTADNFVEIIAMIAVVVDLNQIDALRYCDAF